MPQYSGTFITFEGIDGSGKSTQMEMAAKALSDRGLDVVTTRAPGGTDLGISIRELLLSKGSGEVAPQCELFLFLADRAQHVSKMILPALEAGKVVLCDRFNDSTLAYQAAARKLDVQMIREMIHFACGGLEPSKTMLIDVPADMAISRLTAGAHDRIESASLEFHSEVREAYLELARESLGRISVVDGTGPLEVVEEAVLKELSTQCKLMNI
ncbi:MAG: Thymidylate kinase [Chlamydiia bacterium]|nr:Thymidylate kinase [Chlamydiia bacterium]